MKDINTKKFSFGLTILTICLLFVACERHFSSRDSDLTVPDDYPRVVNLVAQVNSGSVRLVWELTDTANTVNCRVFTSDSINGEYLLRDSVGVPSTSATISSLALNRRYFFKVAPVMEKGLQGDLSSAVTAFVSPLSILIDNNDSLTNSKNVRITINAGDGATHVTLSENVSFVGAVQVPLQGSIQNFTLSTGDGIKRVYARLLFDDGSSTGTPLSDDIFLDTKAEILSVSFNPVRSSYTFGDTIFFLLRAGERSGTASVKVGNLDDISLIEKSFVTDTVNYTGQFVVPANLNLTQATVSGSFADAAGNNAQPRDAISSINIYTSPLPVNLSALAVSTFEITLTWTQSASQDFSAYRLYRGTQPVVTTANQLIATITAPETQEYTDTTLAANTGYFYRILVYDHSGLTSSSNIVTDTTFVNAAPNAVLLVATTEPDSSVALSWTASDEQDFQSYRIYRSNTATVTTANELVGIVSERGTTEFTSQLVSPPATSYFRVFVFDRHGLSTGSNTRSVGP
jgi:hypothetical protein